MAPLIVDIAAFAASEAIEAISEIGPVTDGVCLSLMMPPLARPQAFSTRFVPLATIGCAE